MKFLTQTAMTKVFAPWAICAAVAAGMVVAPAPAPAAGLSDLLAGLSVEEGCSQFTGPRGYPVTVQHFLPGSRCAAPAVILLHGIDGGVRYQSDYEAVAKGLAAKGYAAFIVHYFMGDPTVARPGPNDRRLPDPMAFLPWVDTVKMSVGYVQNFRGVDPARVGMMGTSLGGFVGSSAAANDPRVRSLVVLSGGMPDQYAKNARLMPPTLIVHGDRDVDVPTWEAFKLRDMMTSRRLPNQLVLLPCEGHIPYEHSKEAVAARVLAFFDQTL